MTGDRLFGTVGVAEIYGLSMFVVTLTYRAGLDEIDAALDDHVSWLDEQYTDGVSSLQDLRSPGWEASSWLEGTATTWSATSHRTRSGNEASPTSTR